MIVLNRYYSKWQALPEMIRAFILKGLLLLIIWKSLYLFLFLPHRLLDKPLTNSIAIVTTFTLNLLSSDRSYSTVPAINHYIEDGQPKLQDAMVIYHKGKRSLSIADPCNGLELLVLYIGFIICLPAKRLRKAVFIISGFVIIWILNVLRCAGLSYLFDNNPDLGDFAHHYLFKFIVYSCIFCIWLLYSKKLFYAKAQ
ncbi:MAG TPA: exosortase/archaeosortase family protein [Flavisolibacter sp.]|nr:exosortase/archaeosortase family protein [Flavisolibacter sp.]